MLSFSNVSFRYGLRRWILEDLDFAFPEGSTVLLGPNGAGKSTLLGLGASVLRPQKGSVSVDGLTYRRARGRSVYRQRVMWMPQRIRPIPGLSCREQVAYVGWLKGMKRREAWVAASEAIATAGLDAQMNTKATESSGGQLQRLGVAQAIVHAADLLLMDEPTAGLDPEQRGRFRELVVGLRSRAHLVVSTHQTEDIIDSYDTVVVLAQGRILYSGGVAEFLARAAAGTPEGRQAESAYIGILEDHGQRSA